MAEHDYKNYPELTNSELEEFGFMSPHKQIIEDFRATCIKVHDGDTITLRADFRDFDFPLRFLDIDAPELNAGGEIARDWLKGMIEGTEVEIRIDPHNRVEKWGRLLGRVVSMGMDMGEAELSLGYCVPYGEKGIHNPQNLNKELNLKKWFG